jgi:hypothetical protein
MGKNSPLRVEGLCPQLPGLSDLILLLLQPVKLAHFHAVVFRLPVVQLGGIPCRVVIFSQDGQIPNRRSKKNDTLIHKSATK